MLATMVPIMAISFRRLHDANRTGWWFLLGHVGTILALAMLVVIAFGLVIIEIGMIMVIPHEPPKLDFHDPNSFPGMLLTLFYVSLGMAGISLIIQAFLYSLPSKPEGVRFDGCSQRHPAPLPSLHDPLSPFVWKRSISH